MNPNPNSAKLVRNRDSSRNLPAFIVLTFMLASCDQSPVNQPTYQAQERTAIEKDAAGDNLIGPTPPLKLSYPLGKSSIAPETSCVGASRECRGQPNDE